MRKSEKKHLREKQRVEILTLRTEDPNSFLDHIEEGLFRSNMRARRGGGLTHRMQIIPQKGRGK